MEQFMMTQAQLKEFMAEQGLIYKKVIKNNQQFYFLEDSEGDYIAKVTTKGREYIIDMMYSHQDYGLYLKDEVLVSTDWGIESYHRYKEDRIPYKTENVISSNVYDDGERIELWYFRKDRLHHVTYTLKTLEEYNSQAEKVEAIDFLTKEVVKYWKKSVTIMPVPDSLALVCENMRTKTI